MNEFQGNIAMNIVEAVRNNSVDKLNECIRDFSEFCFKDTISDGNSFPEDIFSMIIRLNQDDQFLKMDGSHHLLLVFETDWGRLTNSQKFRLLETLSCSFDQFQDGMSYFVISELLGEYYCNKESFDVLCKLKLTTNEIARSLIPHGFEHIVRETDNLELRRRAISELLAMRSDESLIVKREVEDAISNAKIEMNGE